MNYKNLSSYFKCSLVSQYLNQICWVRRAGCLSKRLHRPAMPSCPDADTCLQRRRVAAIGKCSCCVCMCVGENDWVPDTDTVTKIERAKWENRKDIACMTNSFINSSNIYHREMCLFSVWSADSFYKFAWQMVIWVWTDLMGPMLHFSVSEQTELYKAYWLLRF